MFKKSLRFSFALLIITLGLIGVGCNMNQEKSEYSDDKFKVGQEWNYKTREGEEKSTIKILKLEKGGNPEVVVHISVSNLNIIGSDGKEHHEVNHLPFNKSALEKSVTTIVSENVTLPDYKEGYNNWKKSFDNGKAGIWTVTVSEALKAMEEAFKQN